MSLGKEEKTHENPLPELFLKRKKVDHAAVNRELAEKKRVREERFQQTEDPNADDFTEGVNWYWKDQPKFNYCWYLHGPKDEPLYGYIPVEAMQYLSHDMRTWIKPKKPEEKPAEKPEEKKPVKRKRKATSALSKKKKNIKTTSPTQPKEKPQPEEKAVEIDLGEIHRTEKGFRMSDILDGVEAIEEHEVKKEASKRKKQLKEKKKKIRRRRRRR